MAVKPVLVDVLGRSVEARTAVSNGITVNSAISASLFNSEKNAASIASSTEPDWSMEIAILA